VILAPLAFWVRPADNSHAHQPRAADAVLQVEVLNDAIELARSENLIVGKE
jgi:hypothetical protein